MPDILPSPPNRSSSEKDFTAGGIFALAEQPKGTTGDKGLDARLRALAAEFVPDARSRDLVAGLLMTSLKIGRDQTGMGDLKMIHRALREMRYANKIFFPWRHVRKVTVFGSARTPSHTPEYDAASRFAHRMCELGFMVITGAGDGIMGAAQKGAGREHSFGLNIKLPFEQQANEIIKADNKLVTFNYFFTRKLSFVKEADAFAMFPGGFGTLDEMFEAVTLIQTGKANVLPIVLVDAPGGTYWNTFLAFLREHLLGHHLISEADLSLLYATDDVESAVQHVVQFYRVFHSYRYVKDTTVFRLKRKLTQAALQRLGTEFKDLIVSGELEQCGALPEEMNEDGIIHLPRLIGKLGRREYGRMRQFIDALNHSEVVPAKP
jgi:uncharacterized protein (TIGR00730 family)